MCPVGAMLFHVDGQTDMTKLIVTFHNIVNVLKIMLNHITRQLLKSSASKHTALVKSLQMKLGGKSGN